MDRNLQLRLAALGMTLLTGTGLAAADVRLAPEAVSIGGLSLLPTVELDTIYDDNVYGLNRDAAGSFSQRVSPEVRLSARNGANDYAASYAMKAESFSNSSNESYIDQTFGASAHLEPSDRLVLQGSAQYRMLHDDLGTGYTSGIGLANILAHGAVDMYNLATTGGALEYGAADAFGHLTLKVEESQKRYSRSVVAKTRDVDGLSALAGFSARVLPKASVLVNYEREDADYQGVAVPDFTDERYLVGMNWQDAYHSQGTWRLGSDSRTVRKGSSFQKPVWNIDMTWSPLARDSLTLGAAAKLLNADDVGSTDKYAHVNVLWRHEWTGLLSTRLGVDLRNDSFVNPVNLQYRKDKARQYQCGLSYQLRRWLVLEGNLSSLDRNSDNDVYDVKRKVYSIGFQIGL